MIYSVLESNMREAIANPDNQFKDGSINWNFVDADAYHACHNLFKDSETFYEAFHDIAEKIASAFKKNGYAPISQTGSGKGGAGVSSEWGEIFKELNLTPA